MPSAQTEKLMIELFHVDVNEITLEGFAVFLIFQFFCELFSWVMPFNIIVFIVKCFDQDADIVVSSKKMLKLLFGLLLEGIANGIELFLGVSSLAEKIIDGVKAASEGEEPLVLEVRRCFLWGSHEYLSLG